jgi:hypothetical protein
MPCVLLLIGLVPSLYTCDVVASQAGVLESDRIHDPAGSTNARHKKTTFAYSVNHPFPSGRKQ